MNSEEEGIEEVSEGPCEECNIYLSESRNPEDFDSSCSDCPFLDHPEKAENSIQNINIEEDEVLLVGSVNISKIGVDLSKEFNFLRAEVEGLFLGSTIPYYMEHNSVYISGRVLNTIFSVIEEIDEDFDYIEVTSLGFNIVTELGAFSDCKTSVSGEVYEG